MTHRRAKAQPVPLCGFFSLWDEAQASTKNGPCETYELNVEDFGNWFWELQAEDYATWAAGQYFGCVTGFTVCED